MISALIKMDIDQSHFNVSVIIVKGFFFFFFFFIKSQDGVHKPGLLKKKVSVEPSGVSNRRPFA